ncbi:MAG: hypothetical protein ACM3PV_05460 [Betaproteobacteria bacterium]
MNRLLAVAARELRERWLLFPAALVLGLIPFVLPAFGVDRRDMPILGLMTAVGLGTAAAVLIGSTMLARDAANGRLGFLFSRPLSWPTIWGGKWLAAVVLVTSSAALAASPFIAVYPPQSHGGSWLRALADGPAWTFFLCLLVLAVGSANFAATAYRSRSPWLVLDLLLMAAALWTARRYVAPLWRFGILVHGEWSPALVLAPLALALFTGSALQVAAGRTDLRRAHRALSLVFWAMVALTLAGAASYWQWVRSAGPADLDVHALTSDPTGRWIYVDGSCRRGRFYPYGYLIDTSSGRYLPRPVPDAEHPYVPWGAVFSEDGRNGALPTVDDHGTALVLFDLSAATPRTTRVSLESSPPPSRGTSYALSPSAGSVFVVHESGASIFALPSGRRTATTTIAPGWRPASVRFLAEGQVRAWLVPWNEAAGLRAARAEMRVLDLAADGRASTTTFPLAGGRELSRIWQSVVADAAGRRIVTLDAGVHLRDGATGALLATLAADEEPAPDTNRPTSTLQPAAVTFLSDGRVVVGEPGPAAGALSGPGVVIRVFDSDGTKVAEHPLDVRPIGLSVGPEVAPGRVGVSSFRLPFLAEDTLVVDVTDGRVVERLKGLRPAIGFWTTSGIERTGRPTSVAFFRDADGRVIRIDFATGTRTTVAGPGAPRGERLDVRW